MRILLLVFLALLLLVAPTLAQGPTNLDSLHIALWPEFDDPRLLVILDGVLSESGATVRVPIPAGAELNAVATAEAAGGFLNAAYETETGADGQIVVFSPQNPGFRIEYYVPLDTSGDQRQVQFALPAGYLSANTTTIEALVPPDAANIATTPPLEAGGVGTSSGQLFQGQVEDEITQGFSQEIRYDNPAGALTVSETARATAAPVVTPAPASPQPADSTSRLPLLLGLGLAAALLIAVGAYGLWRTRRPAPEPAPPASRPAARSDKPRPPAPPASPAAASGQDRFCRQCGAEFQRSDRFCRQCGASRQ